MNDKYLTRHVKTSTNRYLGSFVISENNGELMIAIARVKAPVDTFSKTIGHSLALSRLHKMGIINAEGRQRMTADIYINDSVRTGTDAVSKGIRAKIYEKMSKQMFVAILAELPRAKRYYRIKDDTKIKLTIKAGTDLIVYTES